MTKMSDMATMVLLGWALWTTQTAAGQALVKGACEESVVNSCSAGWLNAAPIHRSTAAIRPVLASKQLDIIESSTVLARQGRSRLEPVAIDFTRLDQAREALAKGRDAGLTLNLSNKLSLSASLTHGSDTGQGYALSGYLADDPLGSVNIVVNGRSVAGHIRRAGKLYKIRTVGGGYFAQRLDEGTAHGPFCEVGQSGQFTLEGRTVPPMQRRPPPQNDGAEDDGTVIDVLVTYTQADRRSAGGHQGIRTLIELLVDETNQAYRDSDAHQRIRLVAATEVDYEYRRKHDALSHLTGKADGHMDGIHQMRDLYAVDLVMLWSHYAAGLAWHVSDPWNVAAERLGFSVQVRSTLPMS